jgi:hypothetical protein
VSVCHEFLFVASLSSVSKKKNVIVVLPISYFSLAILTSLSCPLPSQQFPHTMYAVTGTQADTPGNNKIICLKMSDLHKTKHDQDSDADSEDDENDLDDDPILENRYINHRGTINRLRVSDLFPFPFPFIFFNCAFFSFLSHFPPPPFTSACLKTPTLSQPGLIQVSGNGFFCFLFFWKT